MLNFLQVHHIQNQKFLALHYNIAVYDIKIVLQVCQFYQFYLLRSKKMRCPVEIAMKHLGRKWTIHILRDMFRGKVKFSDYLKENKKLSTKVLSTRLREMEESGLIKKIITSVTPLNIEYHLTEKGLGLNKIIVELSIFSINYYSDEVFTELPMSFDNAISEAKRRFTTPKSIMV